MPRKTNQAIVPIELVQQRIIILRGQRVILAADLAALHGVPTKRLNEAVKRNADRFPDDFMFQLNKDEAGASSSQIVPANTPGNLKSQIATSSWGGARRALPYAFTEHGVLMAATVLNSPQAVAASLFVVRAFVKLRELLSAHHQLTRKLEELERKLQDHDGQIRDIMDAIHELMQPPTRRVPGTPLRLPPPPPPPDKKTIAPNRSRSKKYRRPPFPLNHLTARPPPSVRTNPSPAPA